MRIKVQTKRCAYWKWVKTHLYKTNVEAYFTVEAAFVLPVVFGVMMLVIYLLMFQYNRCLQEQDMGALAMKGCSIQAEDKEELMKIVQEYSGAIDAEKYLAWERDEGSIILEGTSIKVERKGKLAFPFGELLGWNGKQEWQTITTFENQRLSRVSFLRACRKVRMNAHKSE